MREYPELVAATNFSFLEGASHPDEIVQTAGGLGLPAVGICDRNSLAGVVRAFAAAREHDVRVLVGARLVTLDGFEAACLPTDRAAYGRLCRLLTHGRRRAEKGECALTFSDIAAWADDQVFILLPPADPDERWIEKARAFIRLIQHKAAAASLGLSRRFDGRDAVRLHVLTGIAERIGAPPVVIGDVLFHAPERRVLADVLTCVREKLTIDAAGFMLQRNAERHIKSGAEQARLFADHPDALARASELAGLISFSLDEIAYQYPEEVVSPGETPMESLRRRTLEGARRRYGPDPPESVKTAIAHELDVVEELGYAPYFLTVEDLVRFARERGLLCQGRGSAANSVICYCLGVTAVDPSKVALLFERFISADRREPPDIDIDFEHERREEVIQYVYEKYGRSRAALAATVISYRARSAVRDVGKALGLSSDVVDRLARTVWGWSSKGVDADYVREETGLDPDSPRLKMTLELSHALVGFPRHLSQHVGGFVITRDRVDEVVPVENAAMAGRTVVEWDKDDLETLGIIKVDVLALGMLSCIAKALEMLAIHYDRPLGLSQIPPEDPSVYDMICAADTLGVFQIESRAQMSMLPRLKPRSFYDLVIEVAIVRPGPIQGDMVHPYLRRREGLEPVSFPSEELEDVLGKTLGVPLFQEQAMRIAIVAAGFTPSEADQLRRAMATFRRSGTIKNFGLKLVEGMVANGYERAFAERCFRQIEGFGEYGFPESHAASFALLVYASCWLKHHYPDVFLAAILNAQPMGFYAPAQLVRDARAHGVEVLPPDVNASDWESVLEGPARESDGERPRASTEDGGRFPVRLGLRQVKGLSDIDGAKIVNAREAGGLFDSVDELVRRARVSKRGIEKLARADAFGSIDVSRRRALWEARAALPPPPLFAEMGENIDDGGYDAPAMTLGDEVAHDYAALKLSLKGHPVAFFRSTLSEAGCVRTNALSQTLSGGVVSLAGLVLVRQRPGSAQGVIFVTIEDETGVANLIVWPKVFERFRPIVMTAKFLKVIGRVQKQGRVIHVVVEHLTDLTTELAGLSEGEAPVEALARADEVRSQASDRRREGSTRLGKTRLKVFAPGTIPHIIPPSRDFH